VGSLAGPRVLAERADHLAAVPGLARSRPASARQAAAPRGFPMSACARPSLWPITLGELVDLLAKERLQPATQTLHGPGVGRDSARGTRFTLATEAQIRRRHPARRRPEGAPARSPRSCVRASAFRLHMSLPATVTRPSWPPWTPAIISIVVRSSRAVRTDGIRRSRLSRRRTTDLDDRSRAVALGNRFEGDHSNSAKKKPLARGLLHDCCCCERFTYTTCCLALSTGPGRGSSSGRRFPGRGTIFSRLIELL
jgi:streptolysin S family bacteriocin protoxin